MPLERLERRVSQACNLIVTLREEKSKLEKEISLLQLRREALERAARASQVKVAELLVACERVQ